MLREPRGGARGERRGRGSCARGEDRAAGRGEWGPGGRGARGRRWEAGAVPLRRRSRKEAGSGSLPAQVSRPRVTGGGTSRSWRRAGGGAPLPLHCRGPQGRGIQSRPCQFLRAGLGQAWGAWGRAAGSGWRWRGLLGASFLRPQKVRWPSSLRVHLSTRRSSSRCEPRFRSLRRCRRSCSPNH